MKKAIFFFLFAALALVSCEDVTEIYVDNPAVQFDVSSEHIVFSADGGSKTVLIATNMEWDYSSSASWYSVSKGDGSLVITADANTSSPREDELIITATSEMAVYSATVVVAQLSSSSDAIDLSATETANCYMANTSTSYCINALVKGNGVSTEGGAESYISEYGVTIKDSDIVYADLLWEAVLDGDKTSSHNVIDGAPIYSDGYVWFTTGSSEGNAVISVKNGMNEVLWSWHIWVTDDEITEQEGNGYYWMDRNLGAKNNEPEDVNNRGLLYQWGRKDPFMPSTAPYGSKTTEVRNEQVGDGSGEWDYTSRFASYAALPPGNIPIAVQNPMTILTMNPSNVGAWYITLMTDDLYYCYLWGNSQNASTYVKSMFDPCPAGYCVPVDEAWYSERNAAVNSWTAGTNGFYWTGGSNAFYPAAGGTGEEGMGSLGATGTYGYYWSSGMYTGTMYPTCMLFNKSSYDAYSYTYPILALSVRCMRVE
ncbi:MAG: hypothetical protein LUD72_09975 [Bacteroidales bacterium]|nr:hypothetical protein [Bacteroidales bacterium]